MPKSLQRHETLTKDIKFSHKEFETSFVEGKTPPKVKQLEDMTQFKVLHEAPSFPKSQEPKNRGGKEKLATGDTFTFT